MNAALSLCMGLAGVVWAELPTSSFTLAWMHTIEKVRWEEDYRVTPDGLLLDEARIRGTGAGMEVPDNAVLRDGAWHYQVELAPLHILRLGRTPEAGDYEICLESRCRPMSDWLGPPLAERPVVELWVCRSGTPGNRFPHEKPANED